MSMWVSVYCRKPLGRLQPNALESAIRDRLADFDYLFGGKDPDATLKNLRITECKRGKGQTPLLHLAYEGKSGVPIVIDHITDTEVARGMGQEYMEEYLRGVRGHGATRVRKHLRETAEVVSFCLKQSHFDGMGLPMVYAATTWLAEEGDGLVRSPEGWFAIDPKQGVLMSVLDVAD